MNKKTNHSQIEVKNPPHYLEPMVEPDPEEMIDQEEIDPDVIPDEEFVTPP